MSDVQSVQSTQVQVAYLTRIGTGEMIGSDKEAIRNLPDNEPRVLGTVYGVARSVSFRNNTQNAEEGPATALIGAFEFVPSSPSRPVLRSATCYLPKSVHGVVVEQILGRDIARPTEMPKRGKKQDVLGMETPIMFEIHAKKSEGAVGYAFETRQMVKLENSDPLKAVRHAYNFQIPGRSNEGAALALPAPDKGQGAAAPAAKGKGKGKGK